MIHYASIIFQIVVSSVVFLAAVRLLSCGDAMELSARAFSGLGLGVSAAWGIASGIHGIKLDFESLALMFAVTCFVLWLVHQPQTTQMRRKTDWKEITNE